MSRPPIVFSEERRRFGSLGWTLKPGVPMGGHGGKAGRVGGLGWLVGARGGNAVANWEGRIRIGQESDAHAHWRANKEDRGDAIHLFVVKVG